MKTGIIHPIVDRFLPADRPIGDELAPHRAVQIARNRHTRDSGSSDCKFQPSRHSDRQNGEKGGPESRIPGDPADFPAILRDSPVSWDRNGESGRFFCLHGRRRTKSGQESGHCFRILRTPHHPAYLAAVVLDTGAASRGSSNAGTHKEKTVRQWFVDQDLIESVPYLPENLFYNTTAPGVVLFLNRAKPRSRQGAALLVNASQVFEKGDPKNFIPEAGIQRIGNTKLTSKHAS